MPRCRVLFLIFDVFWFLFTARFLGNVELICSLLIFVFFVFLAVTAKSFKAFKYAPVGRLMPVSHLATVTCVAAIVSANFC